MADTPTDQGELTKQSQHEAAAKRLEEQELLKEAQALLLEYERLSDADIATATKYQIKDLRKGKIPPNVDERIYAALNTRMLKSVIGPVIFLFIGLAVVAFGAIFAIISAVNGEQVLPGLGLAGIGLLPTALGYFPAHLIDRRFHRDLERFSTVTPELPKSEAGPAPLSGSPFDVPPQE